MSRRSVALRTLASAVGRDGWQSAGGRDVEISRPRPFRVRPHPRSTELATAAFRETLQDLPTRSEAHRVMGVLQSMVAAERPLERNAEAIGPLDASVSYDRSNAAPSPEGESEIAPTERQPGRTGIPLRLDPGQHVRATFRATLPLTAAGGAADVWRIVEHTAGRITGGVTIVVRAK